MPVRRAALKVGPGAAGPEAGPRLADVNLTGAKGGDRPLVLLLALPRTPQHTLACMCPRWSSPGADCAVVSRPWAGASYWWLRSAVLLTHGASADGALRALHAPCGPSTPVQHANWPFRALGCARRCPVPRRGRQAPAEFLTSADAGLRLRFDGRQDSPASRTDTVSPAWLLAGRGSGSTAVATARVTATGTMT